MSMKTNRSLSPTRIDVPVAGGSLAAFWLGPRDEHVAPVLAFHGITWNSRAWVAVEHRLEADRHAAVLAAWADHDLVVEQPELRSAAAEEAVRADAADLFESGDDARRLTVPATLLCAPSGLLDDPNQMQPVAVAQEWAAGEPQLRQA